MKERQKFEHLPVHPETRKDVDELGGELAKNKGKRKISYDKILKYLILLSKRTEIIIEVTEDGCWILPSQKEKGKCYGVGTPIHAMTRMLARELGQKVGLNEKYKFKIVAVEQEK